MDGWEDYYALLGVDPNSSDDEIKNAYLYKANILHPDKTSKLRENLRQKAEEGLKAINRAYEVLKDEQKRTAYYSEWLTRNKQSKKSSNASMGSKNKQAPRKKRKSKSTRLQKYDEYKGSLSNIRRRFPKSKIFIPAVLGIIILGFIVGLSIAFWPPDPATTAQDGDTVKVDYTGTLDDGTVFDSTINASFNHAEPLEFTIGAGNMIPGFEKGVIGMSVNETKNIHIPAKEAYGQKYFEVDLDELPEDTQVGETFFKTDDYGRTIEATVINISESIATLENTEPMAGENLNFEITLVELIKAE
ncbi:MAG: FKBP-type peptidyl-prolyl cis-trans isomerase [Chloroflexota bacterium]|nr:FKBP-type peptidyl-prolyl cis-trans isomerase [Chloroflexota bacterium]